MSPAEILAKRADFQSAFVLTGDQFYLKHMGATVDAAGHTAALSSDGENFCWIIYSFSELLDSDKPLTVQVAMAQPLPARYGVGIADYRSGAWSWRLVNTPSGADTLGIADSLDAISAGGRLYVALVVYGSDAATLSSLRLETDTAAPPPLSFAASDGASGSTIHLSWDDPADSYAGLVYTAIRLERAEGATGPWTQLAQVASGVTQYDDVHTGSGGGENDIPYNQLLYYRARTVAGTDAGAPSAADMGLRLLADVAGLAASDGAYPDKVVISWGSVAGASGYDLEYRSADGRLPGAWTALVHISDGSTTSFEHTATVPAGRECAGGCVYAYRARAAYLDDCSVGWGSTDSGYYGDVAPWPMFGRCPTRDRQSLHTAAQTNHVQWSYPAGGSSTSSPAVGADGTIYFGHADGNLYAITAAGEYKWACPTGGWIGSSPAIAADGTLYVGSSDKNLYAIWPDGTVRWDFPTGEKITSSPVIGAGGIVYVGSFDDNLYAIKPDGTLNWAFPTGGDVRSSPALDGEGVVYVGSDDGQLYAVHASGTLKWAFPTGGSVSSSPALGADGTVYVGSEDGKLYAINPDGSQLWAFPTGAGIVDSSPAVGSDGTVYIGCYDYQLYAVCPDGTLKWAYPTGLEVLSSPALGADGTVYFGSNDCSVYALEADGALRWSYPTGNDVYSSPAIGADGTLYAVSEDGTLYAFGE